MSHGDPAALELAAAREEARRLAELALEAHSILSEIHAAAPARGRISRWLERWAATRPQPTLLDDEDGEP